MQKSLISLVRLDPVEVSLKSEFNSLTKTIESLSETLKVLLEWVISSLSLNLKEKPEDSDERAMQSQAGLRSRAACAGHGRSKSD